MAFRRLQLALLTLALSLCSSAEAKLWAQPDESALSAKLKELRAIGAVLEVESAVTEFLRTAEEAQRPALIERLSESLSDAQARDSYVRGVLLTLSRSDVGASLDAKWLALLRGLGSRFDRRLQWRDLVQRYSPRDRLLYTGLASLGAAGTMPADPVALWLIEQFLATDAERREVVLRVIEYGLSLGAPAEEERIVAALRRIALQSLSTLSAWDAWAKAFAEKHPTGFSSLDLHIEERGRWLDATRATVRYFAGRGDLRGLLPFLDGERGDDPELIALALRSLVQAAGLDKERRIELVDLLLERWPRIVAQPTLERIALEALPALAQDATAAQQRLAQHLAPILRELPEVFSTAALERVLFAVRALASCTDPKVAEAIAVDATAAYARLVQVPAPADNKPDLAAAVRRELINGLDRWNLGQETLHRALSDPAASVRQFAASALSLRERPEDAAALAKALAAEPLPEIRASLLKNLGEMGHFGVEGVAAALQFHLRPEEAKLVREAAVAASLKGLSAGGISPTAELQEALLSALFAQDLSARVTLLSGLPEKPSASLMPILLAWVKASAGPAERARLANCVFALQSADPRSALEAAQLFVDAEPGLIGLSEALTRLRQVFEGEANGGDPARARLAAILSIEARIPGANDLAALAPLETELDALRGTPEGAKELRGWWTRARLHARQAALGRSEATALAVGDYREALDQARAAAALTPALSLEAGEYFLQAKAFDAAQATCAQDLKLDSSHPLFRRQEIFFALLALEARDFAAARRHLAAAKAAAAPPPTDLILDLEVRIACRDRDPAAWATALVTAESLSANKALSTETAAAVAEVQAAKARVTALDQGEVPASAFAPEDPARLRLILWLLHDIDALLATESPSLTASTRRLSALAILLGTPEDSFAPEDPSARSAHETAWSKAKTAALAAL